MKHAIVLSLLLLGCKKPAPVLETIAPPAVTPAKPEMPKAGPPSWAYINTSKVVAIDPTGKISSIDIPKGELSWIARADGKAFAIIQDTPGVQIARLEGARLVPVGSVPECYPSHHGVFTARDDHMAIHCQEGLFEKTGETWTKVPLPIESYEHRECYAKTGALWYATDKGIFERRGTAWKRYEGPPFTLLPSTFFEAHDSVYFTSSTSFYRIAGDRYDLSSASGGWSIESSANAMVGSWDHKETYTLRTIEGDVTTVPTKITLGRSWLDDRGRAWSLDDAELDVVDPSTGQSTRVPMGSYPELDRIVPGNELVILGAGPAVPASRPVRTTKKITGRITLDGKPLANAAMELCPRGGMLYTGATPCAESSPATTFTTTTDAKGAFSVENAPLGTYFLHYKVPGAEKWSYASTEFGLHENAVSDLGTLAYEKQTP